MPLVGAVAAPHSHLQLFMRPAENDQYKRDVQKGRNAMFALREEVERAIAPVELLPRAGHGHQLETVDAQAFKIVETINRAVERVVELLNLQFIDNQVVKFRRFVCSIGPGESGRTARQHYSRKPPHISLASKWVRKPARDELTSAPSRRPPQLKAVQIHARCAEIRASDGSNVDGTAPQIKGMAGIPCQRGINRLDRWIEAITAVDETYNKVESIDCSNLRQVNPKADLKSASGHRREGANFGEVDRGHGTPRALMSRRIANGFVDGCGEKNRRACRQLKHLEVIVISSCSAVPIPSDRRNSRQDSWHDRVPILDLRSLEISALLVPRLFRWIFTKALEWN